MNDQEILEQAQERLLKKREELKATENPIQSITNSIDEFIALLPQCQHGNKVGYCDECKAMKSDYRRNEEEEAEEKAEKEAYLKEAREHPERFMPAEIPKKFRSCSLNNFEGNEGVKTLCREYSNKFIRTCTCVDGGRPLVDNGLLNYPGSILFIGKTGCGKTHLAVSIVTELVRRSAIHDVKFITAPELLLEIRDTFNKNAKSRSRSDDGWSYEVQTENDVIDKYSKCELLILDDLGAEKVSDFTIQSLYLVIDRRNRDLRPTIITTNLTLQEIEEKIDARMASRLSDMQVVVLNMPDYRKKRF